MAGTAKAVVITQGSQASGALAGRRLSDFEEAHALTFTVLSALIYCAHSTVVIYEAPAVCAIQEEAARLNKRPSVLWLLAFWGCELVLTDGRNPLLEFVPKCSRGIEEHLSLPRQF